MNETSCASSPAVTKSGRYRSPSGERSDAGEPRSWCSSKLSWWVVMGSIGDLSDVGREHSSVLDFSHDDAATQARRRSAANHSDQPTYAARSAADRSALGRGTCTEAL